MGLFTRGPEHNEEWAGLPSEPTRQLSDAERLAEASAEELRLGLRHRLDARVASGDGVALMPEHAQKIPHTGAAFVKLTAPVPTTELLLVQPKGKPGPEMATLGELIAERAVRVPE